MNQSEDRLSAAFRDLAAGAPKMAPPELGIRLKESFRKRQAQRKRIRMCAGATLIVCTALALLFVVARGLRERAAPSPVEAVQTDDPLVNGVISGEPAVKQESRAEKERHKPTRRKRSYSPTKEFVPLPTYHPSIASEAYQVVRVGLRDQSLGQLGIPIAEEASGKRLVADLLVDRDGLPMAVRFVGWQKVK